MHKTESVVKKFDLFSARFAGGIFMNDEELGDLDDLFLKSNRILSIPVPGSVADSRPKDTPCDSDDRIRAYRDKVYGALYGQIDCTG